MIYIIRLFEHKIVHVSSGVGVSVNIDIKKEYNCTKCGQIFKRRSNLKVREEAFLFH